MKQVKLYTKHYCPYSKRVKQLLNQKGVPYEEIDIDGHISKKDEMVAVANGRTTTPQVFIDGEHVGGCDQLEQLERTGRLDLLLGREGSQPQA